MSFPVVQEVVNPLHDIDEWQDDKLAQEQEKVYECTSGKATDEFRNYVDSDRHERVEKFYTQQHEKQSVASVKADHDKYLQLNHVSMGIWEALEVLDSLVDDSDPDTEVSQLQHALMTAEAIKKKYPGSEYEWFRVTGLIHDLGKLLSAKWGEPQYKVVGDTFPVGCKFNDKNVFPETFKNNPDFDHPVYSTEHGIYEAGCGLSNVTMSWGHDEYLYQVCVQNGCKIPLEGLYMIRFHSFYPWHKENAYKWMEDEQDKKMLFWVREFNQFDLYSKGDEIKNVDELKKEYQEAVLRYFPEKLRW